MLGGLARRVALAEKARTVKQSLLVVDSGDLFFAPYSGADAERKLVKARLISRAYQRMGTSAINVGDLDLLQGVEFLRDEFSKGLPLISANLLDPSTKAPIFPPYVIREVAGVRVAFSGLLNPESAPDVGVVVKNANEGKIFIQDPFEAARETLQKLKGQADLVILLSDLGLHKDQMLAKAVSGIHFILGGHEGRYMGKPQQMGNTHILQSSVKGMYVGRLRLIVGDTASPFSDGGEVQHIQDRINALDFHLRSLQQAKQQLAYQNPENLDRSIQEVTKQRRALQDQLMRMKDSASQGNRFFFNLEPIEAKHSEDDEVRKWIAEAGIEKD